MANDSSTSNLEERCSTSDLEEQYWEIQHKLAGNIDTPFNIEEILRACPVLYECWKKHPFVFDLDGGVVIVRYLEFDERNRPLWLQRFPSINPPSE